MKQLTNEQIVDYLDGTLSAEETARLEAFLENNPEDAALVQSLQFANAATRDLREADTFQVSENFWPALRDQLGPPPRRSFVGGVSRSLAGGMPRLKVPRFSMGVALGAAAVCMGVFFFAPQESINQPTASPISAADMAFIQSSVDLHKAYVAVEPVEPGDTSVKETGAEDYEERIP